MAAQNSDSWMDLKMEISEKLSELDTTKEWEESGKSPTWQPVRPTPPVDFAPHRARLVKRGGIQALTEEGQDVQRPAPPQVARTGRPKGKLFEGKNLRELRGSVPRTVFARLCKISPDTLDRAERGARLSKGTIDSIERYLKTLNKNRPQKPQ